MKATAAVANENMLVQVLEVNKATVLTLNRPKALNALSLPMCESLRGLFQKWQQPNDVKAVILKGAGGKSFCAGGDVKSIWEEIKKGDLINLGTGKRGLLSSDFFRVEYEMNYLMANSKSPQVSFWDGIVMGGGVGASVHGKFRVATEKSMFAMPETAIGIIPDVGSSCWLPHLKKGFGNYIGLTGCRLSGVELIHTGIATHFISSDRLKDLEREIINSTYENPQQYLSELRSILDSFSTRPDLRSSPFIWHEASISRCFEGKKSVEEVMECLELEAADPFSDNWQWARDTIETLAKMSPTALKLTLAQLERGHSLDLAECLRSEFRVMMRCMRPDADFSEGVRALLVDKDGQPQWRPARLQDVSPAAVDAFFAPLGEHDLDLSRWQP